MADIVVLAEKGCVSSGIAGTLDAFSVANMWWLAMGEGNGQPLFKPAIVTVDGKPVRENNGIELQPEMAIDQVEKTDLIMVPALFPPFNLKNSRMEKICGWLKMRYASGDCIASTCTGAFILAEAGLLNGKIATTNWQVAALFRKLYPEVKLCVDQILTEEANLICTGAFSAYLDLCLYIIDRFGSPALASQCTKSLLVDPDRCQAPYVIHGFWKNHADGQVLKAQLWMEENYSQKVSIDALARDVGISPRQFARRFKHATGETPVAYLQHLRIENAKKRLETTLDTVNEITWQVGYEDINSFRRLFVKHTGLAPREYRNKFARPGRETVVL